MQERPKGRIGSVMLFVLMPGALAMGGGPGAELDSMNDGLVPHDFVAYWSFDETGGSTVYDAVIGIEGELHGATRAHGISGNALAFGGRNDFVEIHGDAGFPTELGELSEGTISVWFKIDSVPGVETVYPMFYLGSRDGKSSLIIEIGHFSSNSALFFTIYEDGFPPQCFDSGYNLQLDTWYHFAAVVGPDFNTGYLNGEEMVDRDYNFGNAASHLFLSDVVDKEVCWIGRGFFGNLPQDQYFDGVIDEVQVFNRALDAAEVRGIYTAVTDAASACELDPSAWPDVDGDGVPDECCAASAPLLPADTVAMNRYVSFESSLDDTHAIRIVPVDLPHRFEHLIGRPFWVGPVQDVSELPGRTDRIGRTFRAATLQCEPLYGNWSALGPIHVFHESIIPGGRYEIQAVKSGCGRNTEWNFSDPLSVATSDWGDLAGRYGGSAWTGPNGQVDVIVDVVAILEKFRNAPGAPVKARADLHPSTPDRIISILDVVMANDAFRGRPYPFTPSDAPCDQ